MTENEVAAPSRRKIPHVGWFFAAAVVLSPVAIIVAWILPFVQQVELIPEIESRGGKVVVISRGPTWVRSLTRHLSNHSVTGAPQLSLLDRIEEVSLYQDSFNSANLQKLPVFRQMLELRLCDSTLTDNDMLAISGCRSVRNLALVYCRFDGLGFEALERMRNLESLDISFTHVRDAALGPLERHPNLKTLYIYGCRDLTPDGIVDFARTRPDIEIVGIPNVVRVWKDAGLLSVEQESQLSALPNAGAEKPKNR